VETQTALTRREATLRAAATACLAGIALVQALELPSLFVQGRQLAALSLAAMALCIGVGWTLAAGPAVGRRHLWRLVAATAVLVLAGWAVPRVFALPGVAHHQGHWISMPGALCGALAAACLVLSAAAVRPTRRAVRGLALAAVLVLAFGPGAGALLVALGPGLPGGETALAAGAHFHAHGGVDQATIRFQPIGGGGGHYVYKTAAPAHQTPFGVALIIGAALVFTYGAVGHLRRRSAAPAVLASARLEGRLA
jgi:hypothetical protein